MVRLQIIYWFLSSFLINKFASPVQCPCPFQVHCTCTVLHIPSDYFPCFLCYACEHYLSRVLDNVLQACLYGPPGFFSLLLSLKQVYSVFVFSSTNSVHIFLDDPFLVSSYGACGWAPPPHPLFCHVSIPLSVLILLFFISMSRSLSSSCIPCTLAS